MLDDQEEIGGNGIMRKLMKIKYDISHRVEECMLSAYRTNSKKMHFDESSI